MKLLLTTIALFTTLLGFGQTKGIIVNPSINLTKDSIESKQLVTALNGLLNAVQQNNEQNSHVLPTQQAETYVLLDEIKGIEKSNKFKDEHFYKPYLTNVVLLADKSYAVMISYIGINEHVAMLRASFELIAHRSADSFLFSSPLMYNTKIWKTTKIGNTVFHYKNSLNTGKANEYVKYISLYDGKLKLANKATDIYCFDNLRELQKLSGIEYKTDYNGQTGNSFISISGNKKLIVTSEHKGNFNYFDPHDLWHARLAMAASRTQTNRPVDEGCAFLYGGSWGLSWQEIYSRFKTKVASDKNTDWQAIKEKPLDFSDNPREPLVADYIVNALIVRKLEKEKGFTAVWELLNCGKAETGNNNYYQSLQQLTGVTKEEYNQYVWKLVDSYK